MNEEGEIVSNCGSYPNYMDGEDLISNFPKFMFHQTMFGFREKDSCLVCVTNHVLDFWNSNKKELLLKILLKIKLMLLYVLIIPLIKLIIIKYLLEMSII